MRLMKPAAVALALGVAATAFAPSAVARDRHHNAFIAGAAGFAAGALFSSFVQPRHYGYSYDDYGSGYYQQRGYGYQQGGYGYQPRGYSYQQGSFGYQQPRSYGYQQPRYYAPAQVYVAPPRAYYREEGPRYDGCSSASGVSRPANSLC